MVKKYTAALTLILAIGGLLGIMIIQDKTPVPWNHYALIAHAGGGVNGIDYTNSEEAIKGSYKNGFRLFELDVTLSEDGIAVVRHDWDDKYGQELFFREGQPLSYSDFMNSKYYSRYTPMDIPSVVKLMKRLDDIYVIIDARVKKPGDANLIYKSIADNLKDVSNDIRSRFIAQFFYKSDLQVVQSYGFNEVLYVAGREGWDIGPIIQFIQQNNLTTVSLNHSRVDSDDLKKLKVNKIKAYLHTLNDAGSMKTLQEAGAHGFFTDFITPDDLQ